MILPIITIRPEPGCSATVEAGKSAGLIIQAFPLFEIRPVEWDAPAVQEVDALLLGSANAVRHAGPQLLRFHGKPAYCVGQTTARVAAEYGLEIAAMGEGGLQKVLDGLAGEEIALLRLAGAERVPLTPPYGVSILTRISYESVAVEARQGLANTLAKGAVVLLHSAAAARHFTSECDRFGLDRSHLALAALGPRIAEAAGSGWLSVQCAEFPRDEALLSLARDMCQKVRHD